MTLPTLHSLNFLKSYFNETISVLDVGANKGQFVIEIKRLFNNCNVVSIEPNPNCEIFLKKLDIEYYICGLGSIDSVIQLVMPRNKKTSKGASFFPDKHWEKTKSIDSNVCVADKLFKGRSFDLIKIDTQGYELEVIKGSRELIKKSKFLIVECNVIPENIGAPTFKAVIEELEKLEFYLNEVIEERFNEDKELFQVDAVFTNTIDQHNKEILKRFS